MLRDITLGQYYPSDSVVHRLDPRVKLAGTMIYIISLFINETIIGYIIAAIFLIMVVYISKIPFKYILKGVKGIMFILVISVIFNIFLTPGQVIFRLGFIKITLEGLKMAGKMAVRLLLLITGTTIMTLTTTPNDLTDGLEKSLGFLKKIHVPVHEIAMMMSIALRFIPILIEETDKIMKAQMARGADFETGNIVTRAKNMVPLLVPLFISSFRRASDLAMAMEARCYRGGEGRTKLKPLKYRKKDGMAYGILFVYLCIVFLTGFLI